MSNQQHDLPTGKPDELEIFAKAVELDGPQRIEYLRRVCGDDARLLNHIQSLLALDDQAHEEFLAPPPLNFKSQLAFESKEDAFIGRTIGAFKISKRIGQGGMGEVYLAKRSEGYKQDVAIKVLRGGMENQELLRRFEAETQFTAALGKHPNIAGLIDAGTTDDGLFYLVMDYVNGQRIDDYCDSKALSTHDRLRLFQKVCDAVQFAHQNTVIHRDLKPSNILVSHEGEVKLIDFGIAKLINPQLSFQSESTRTIFRVLTPEYASPEQARGETLTTASDVYSLGVILYGLLTGRSPYEITTTDPLKLAQTLESVEPAHPRNAIEQPTSKEEQENTVEEIASLRRATPASLKKQLGGDLGKVILMALRKEPERRYGTAQQFADDLRQYLSGYPVRAQRDTVAYRTRKFIRRNRLAVTAGMVVCLTLLLGIIGTSTQWFRAKEATRQARLSAQTASAEATRANQLARSEAEARIRAQAATELAQSAAREATLQAETAQQVSDFMWGLFQGADRVGMLAYQFGPPPSQGGDLTARQLVEQGRQMLATELQDQPLIRASLGTKIARIYLSLGSLDSAIELLEESHQLQTNEAHFSLNDSIDTLFTMGLSRYIQGNYEAANELFDVAIKLNEDTQDNSKKIWNEGTLKLALGFSLLESSFPGSFQRAKVVLKDSLKLRRSQKDVAPADLAHALIGNAIIERASSNLPQAMVSITEAGALLAKIPDGGLFLKVAFLTTQSTLNWQGGKYDKAYKQAKQALDLAKQQLGSKHPLVNYIQVDQAKRMFNAGEIDKAETFLREAIVVARESYGRQPRTARAMQYLGRQLVSRKEKLVEAVDLLREAYEINSTVLGPNHFETIRAMQGLANGLAANGNTAEARRLREQLSELQKVD